LLGKAKHILCGFLLLLAGKVFPQDVEMSQYFSAPLMLNPALAGISYGPRVTLNYRNEWAGLGNGFNGGYTTYAAGFDMHVDAIKAGLGALFVGDEIANGLYASYKASLIYSQQIKFNRHSALKIGLEGSYIHTGIEWNQLLWSDMINPLTGFYNNVNVPNPTSEASPARTQTNTGDMSAGLVYFTEKLYVGFAVNNLLMHKESFTDVDAVTTPMNYVLHFGANLPIRHPKELKYNIWLSPNVLLVNQGKAFQEEGTLLTGISVIYFGLGYRNVIANSDAVIGYVGFKKGKVRVGYSYDYTISKLAGQTGGTHELSFTFNWTGDDNSLNPKKNRGYVPCPDILKF
jgi:type IX secretion system PorP/SprF family membrane protein